MGLVARSKSRKLSSWEIKQSLSTCWMMESVLISQLSGALLPCSHCTLHTAPAHGPMSGWRDRHTLETAPSTGHNHTAASGGLLLALINRQAARTAAPPAPHTATQQPPRPPGPQLGAWRPPAGGVAAAAAGSWCGRGGWCWRCGDQAWSGGGHGCEAATVFCLHRPPARCCRGRAQQ